MTKPTTRSKSPRSCKLMGFVEMTLGSIMLRRRSTCRKRSRVIGCRRGSGKEFSQSSSSPSWSMTAAALYRIVRRILCIWEVCWRWSRRRAIVARGIRGSQHRKNRLSIWMLRLASRKWIRGDAGGTIRIIGMGRGLKGFVRRRKAAPRWISFAAGKQTTTHYLMMIWCRHGPWGKVTSTRIE